MSDRYTRVAKQRASNMQRDTFSDATPSDSLAEDGCLEQIWECQKKEGPVWWHCCGSEGARSDRTGAGDATTSGRRPAGRRRICRGRRRTLAPAPRESGEQERTAGVEQGQNSTPLGDIPRKTRQALRAELEQGLNVSFVGKKRIQTLRNFGSSKVIWYGIPCGLSILERLCFANQTTS